MMQGHLAEAARVACALAEEAEAAGDVIMKVYGHTAHAVVLARQGRAAQAQAAAQLALESSDVVGGATDDTIYSIFADATLVAGDAEAAMRLCEMAWRRTTPLREVFTRSVNPIAEAALACGDLEVARRWADENVVMVPGWQQAVALTTRAYIAMAQREPGQAKCDAHDSLRSRPGLADTYGCPTPWNVWHVWRSTTATPRTRDV